MSNRLFILLFFFSFSLFNSSIAQQRKDALWQPFYIAPRSGDQHISLDGTWSLGYSDNQIAGISEISGIDNWFETTVPGGTIHWALYRDGQLPNMYEHLNSNQYEWIETKSWYYKRTFSLEKAVSGQYAFFCFDGIDYFSRVWLNGEYLGYHEGMYGGPAIEVSKLLKKGDNEVVVEVRSGIEDRPVVIKGQPIMPGKVLKGWEFTGGNGAEPFYTLGMWQGIRLEMVSNVHLERPFLITKKIDNGKAILQLKTEVLANTHSLLHKMHAFTKEEVVHGAINDLNYQKFMSTPIKQKASIKIQLYEGEQVKTEQEWPVTIFESRNWISEEFEIENPRLWWPNGLGNSDLYKVKVSLLLDGETADVIEFDYGIRTIETTTSAGPQVGDFWDDWQFVINGKPIFMKGINWMPADLLMDLPEERYRWLIGLARDAGVQAFRIWGAGLIETENFYKICNEMGIMVWAEYSMANWDAPEIPQDVFEAQIMWTIFRLRNHPSLLLHCGGNEYNPYSIDNAPLTGILERSVEMFDPTRPFRRASPDEGSIHTYKDMDPTWYPKIYKYVPYISETGMHSITDPKGLYEIVEPKEFENLGDMYSESFSDTHPEFIHHFVEFGANRVPRMLSRAAHIDDMSNPSLESISEASQVAAGEFYQVLSELTQANYPVTTGLMPWVFKRPWPVVSGIHLVDGFGQPSAPYYFLKRTYENVHVMCALDRLLWKPEDTVAINAKVLNLADSEGLKNGFIQVRVFDDKFKVLKKFSSSIEIKPEPAVTELLLGDYFLPKDYRSRYFYIVTELNDKEGRLVSRSVYWPRTIPQMEDTEFYNTYVSEPVPWPTLANGPWLKPIVSKTKTRMEAKLLKAINNGGQTHVQISVKNTGKLPAFMTQFKVDGAKRVFVMSDNFFWLAPGEEKIIEGRIQWREEIQAKNPHIQVSAWNAKPVTITLSQNL